MPKSITIMYVCTHMYYYLQTTWHAIWRNFFSQYYVFYFFRVVKWHRNVSSPNSNYTTQTEICHQLVHRNLDCSDPQVKLLVLLWFHGKNTFYNNLIHFFYFIDSFEDLSTITMGLQEALAREKMLEDKLITVKNMINKNINLIIIY